MIGARAAAGAAAEETMRRVSGDTVSSGKGGGSGGGRGGGRSAHACEAQGILVVDLIGREAVVELRDERGG